MQSQVIIIDQDLMDKPTRPKSRSRSNSKEKQKREAGGQVVKKMNPTFSLNVKNVREVTFKLDINSIDENKNIYEAVKNMKAARAKTTINPNKSYELKDQL